MVYIKSACHSNKEQGAEITLCSRINVRNSLLFKLRSIYNLLHQKISPLVILWRNVWLFVTSRAPASVRQCLSVYGLYLFWDDRNHASLIMPLLCIICLFRFFSVCRTLANTNFRKSEAEHFLNTGYMNMYTMLQLFLPVTCYHRLLVFKVNSLMHNECGIFITVLFVTENPLVTKELNPMHKHQNIVFIVFFCK